MPLPHCCRALDESSSPCHSVGECKPLSSGRPHCRAGRAAADCALQHQGPEGARVLQVPCSADTACSSSLHPIVWPPTGKGSHSGTGAAAPITVAPISPLQQLGWVEPDTTSRAPGGAGCREWVYTPLCPQVTAVRSAQPGHSRCLVCAQGKPDRNGPLDGRAGILCMLGSQQSFMERLAET